jgi:hypothetical protein
MKEVQKSRKLEFWSIPEFRSVEMSMEDSIKIGKNKGNNGLKYRVYAVFYNTNEHCNIIIFILH